MNENYRRKPFSYSPEHALCLGRAGSSCLYLCLFPHVELLVRSGMGLAHRFRLLRVTCLIVLDMHSFSFGEQGYVTFGGRGRAFADLGQHISIWSCFSRTSYLSRLDSIQQGREWRVGKKKKNQTSKGCLSRARASGCGPGFLLCCSICVYQYPALSRPLLGVGGSRERKLSNHQDI